MSRVHDHLMSSTTSRMSRKSNGIGSARSAGSATFGLRLSFVLHIIIPVSFILNRRWARRGQFFSKIIIRKYQSSPFWNGLLQIHPRVEESICNKQNERTLSTQYVAFRQFVSYAVGLVSFPNCCSRHKKALKMKIAIGLFSKKDR